MDYKEKETILRVCSSKKGDRCSRCPAFGHGDRNCARNAMRDAADAIAELMARAESAEKERDAAIKELDGVSNAVGDLADFIDDEIHPIVPYNLYTELMDNVYAITVFEKESEWRGQKEE